MKILAIDASTKNTGIAIFEDEKLIHYTLISNSHKDTFLRIKYMAKELEQIYLEWKPDKIVLEDVIPDQLDKDLDKWILNKNTFTPLMYLQAEIVLMFHQYSKKVTLVGASTWRKNCGIKQGKAVRQVLKQRDIEFVKEKFGIDCVDDIADAICIGYSDIQNSKQQPFNWE